MDHPCPQCGFAVEDGRPFCPHCRAPQIHVPIAAPETDPGASLNSTAAAYPGDLSPPGRADLAHLAAGSAINRSIAVRVALKAGAFGVLIGMIPFLGIVLTGALAVFLYRRETRLTLPPALASRVGGAAGVVAFAINSVLITLQIFVFHAQQRYADDLMRLAQRFGGSAADADLQASIQNLFTPAGLALTLFFGMIFSVLLASAGGALASLFLRPPNSRV